MREKKYLNPQTFFVLYKEKMFTDMQITHFCCILLVKDLSFKTALNGYISPD